VCRADFLGKLTAHHSINEESARATVYRSGNFCLWSKCQPTPLSPWGRGSRRRLADPHVQQMPAHADLSQTHAPERDGSRPPGAHA